MTDSTPRPENSRWMRSDLAAQRVVDEGRVILLDGAWRYIKGRRMKMLSGVNCREDAIQAADKFDAPGLWSHDPSFPGTWERTHWEVRPSDEGWEVWRSDPESGEMTRASVAQHVSPDRARRWVELRLERTGSNLRGPKPRAGSPSIAKLPDIRVTPDEREAAFTMLDALHLSYADFVRAALGFAEEHLDGGSWAVVKEGSAWSFQPRPPTPDPDPPADELVPTEDE